MPLTLGLSILVKRKPPPPTHAKRMTITTKKPAAFEAKVEIGNPKEDSEMMLRRVLEEKDIKLLPGGDGLNADETLKRDRVLTLVDRLFDSDTALAKLKRPTNTP